MAEEQKDPVADGVMRRQRVMELERSCWDSLWQELKELVRPDTSDFAASMSKAADARRRIFDGTAPWALEQLSAGLHSYLTSPVDRWFSLGVTGMPYDRLDHDAKVWLEQVSDLIYAHYSNPFASFSTSMHEAYLDLGGFGTAAIYHWFDSESRSLQFRAYPLADCWALESSTGHVDTVHRAIRWTVRQVRQEFGDLPPGLAKKKDDDKVTVIHAVAPRADGRLYSFPTKKPYSSIYVCKDTGETLHESGYDWMPYLIPRWTKLAGEPYGRSPALSVLPEIRMVNAMSKTMIVAAQKLVDPALAVPDDGFLLPVRQTPGALNYKRPGSDPIEAIPTGTRVEIGIEMIEQRRDMIRRGFYVDWLVRPVKKERQTAQEIMDDRNQMLSMMSPTVGRLQGELLGPMIRLSYNYLAREALLPDMPPSLDGAELEPIYISPAAKAQSTVRGQGVSNYLAQLTQLIPIMPGIMDSVNEDALGAEIADLSDVPRRVINSPAEVASRRKSREQQAQLAAAVEAAPAAAKSAKDLAQAQSLGLRLQ